MTRTLSDALREKYVYEEKNSYETLDVERSEDGERRSSVEQKEGGFTISYLSRSRVRSTHEIETVTLINQQVTLIGDTEWLGQQFKSLCEVDLTGNGISNWQQVFILLSTLNNIHFLNLTNNPLGRVIAPDDLTLPEQEQSFSQIKTLILNFTQIPWKTLNFVLPMVPRLAELHLSGNDYNNVDLQTHHENLISLHFNNNPICEPQHLLSLAEAFPSLSTLIAHNSQLASLILPSESIILAKSFHQLQCLSLSHSRLSTWDDIHFLSLFMSLQKLRLVGIPLLHEIKEENHRPFLIACLQNIQCLNGSTISSEEREAAERMFLRYFQSFDEAKRPPSFHKLLHQHGQLAQLADVCLEPASHVDLNIKFEDLPVVKRKFDVNITTGQLKKELSSDVVGLSPSKFRLYYVDVEDDEVLYGAEEMKVMSRKLFSYRMKSNDQILVQRKHVTSS